MSKVTKNETLNTKVQIKQLVPIIFTNSCCGSKYDNLVQSISKLVPIVVDNQRIVTPDEANLFLIVGPVSNKMLSTIIQTYEQMDTPKWVITVGDCTMVQGIFESSDSIVRPSNYIEVEDHVKGCPPSINDIMQTVEKLLKKISGNKEL